MTPILLLASNSPRRRQLLALTGWAFTVRPVDIDERPLPGEPPASYVERLAKSKALTAGKAALPGQIILAADTTVALDHQILGKPADAAEAHTMLASLRGRVHMVYTALGIWGTSAAAESSLQKSDTLPFLWTEVCATRVWMRAYTDAEIDAYIASGDPFDKAGAYAIQNLAFNPVERIEGCYTCVVGLPVCRVVSGLARYGLTPPKDVTSACSIHLQMDTPCPVYQTLLRVEAEGSQARGKEK